MRTHTVTIYEPSQLPKEGWLQCCIVCREITGNIFNVITIETVSHTIHYEAYLCLKCDNKLMCRTTYNIELAHKTKYKFFKNVNKTIIGHLNKYNIYNFTVENVNHNHTQLTETLRKYTYFPVEPNPPAPLDVSSNSSTNSTRETDDKSGVQI